MGNNRLRGHNQPVILLVDDEPSFTETMTHILAAHQFDVDAVNGAGEAIEKIKSKQYNLLITDINMPDMDGIELIRQVRTMKPDIPIMIVTGFPSHESQEEAFNMGVVNYLVKPFSTKRFLELVQKSLNSERDGFIGPVELSSSDLIQMYSLEARSLVLEVQQGKDIGRIYINKGIVIHAETKDNHGEEAFYEIQTWKTGVFRTSSIEKEVAKTINKSVDVLLVESARRMDELSKASNLQENLRKRSLKKQVPYSFEQDYSKALLKHDKEAKMTFENMKDIDILRYVVEETDGAIAAGLVSMDGISMGAYTTVEGFDSKTADAEFASMFRGAQKTAVNLGATFGDVEELMMVGTNAIVIGRMIGDKYYTGIALTKDGNIGKARMLQQKLVKEMKKRYYGE